MAMASRRVAGIANTSTVYDQLCKVEGCTRELCLERPYYHRLGICAAHVREPQLFVDGQLKRFCQQCAKLHDIDDFDLDKRSCRLMLERHRMRRRLLKAKKEQLGRQGQRRHDSHSQEEGTDSDSDGDPTADLHGTSSLLGRRSRSRMDVERSRAQQSSKNRQANVQCGAVEGEDAKLAGRSRMMGGAGQSPLPSPRSGDQTSRDGGSRGSNCCQVEFRTPEGNGQPAHSGLMCNSILTMGVQHCSPDAQAPTVEPPNINQTPLQGPMMSNAHQHSNKYQFGAAVGSIGMGSASPNEHFDMKYGPNFLIHSEASLPALQTPSNQVDVRLKAGHGLGGQRAIKALLDRDHLQKTVPLTLSQHLGLKPPAAMQTLASLANKAAVQRDTALDIELAALLSDLEAQPVQYMRGLCCLAHVLPPKDGIRNTCGESHSVSPSVAIVRDDDGLVGYTPSPGQVDCVGATSTTCRGVRGGYEGLTSPYSVAGGLSGRAQQALHRASTTGPVLSASLQSASMQPSFAAQTLSTPSFGCEALGKTDTAHLGPRLIQAWPAGPKNWPHSWPGQEPPPRAVAPTSVIVGPPMQVPHRQTEINSQPPGQRAWATLRHPTIMPVAGGELKQNPLQPLPYREQQQWIRPLLQGQQPPR